MKTLGILAALFIAGQANAQTIKPLLSTNETVLITNAEFSSAVGRKIIFKNLDTGAIKSFDVESVSTNALARLNIDKNTAIAKQAAIDKQRAAISSRLASERERLTAISQVETEKNRALLLKQYQEKEEAARDEAMRQAAYLRMNPPRPSSPVVHRSSHRVSR